MNPLNPKNISNLYFPEEVKNLTLDNFYDCIKLDFDKAIANFEKSGYKKICLVKVEGQNPELVDPENSRYAYTGYQVGLCFVNSINDNSVYRVTSTVATDVRLADIYSVNISYMLSNTLTYRTKIGWGVLPITPGIFCLAPNQTIDIYTEKNKNG